MINKARRWQARGSEVLLLRTNDPTSAVYGRYVCSSMTQAETLAQNLNVMQDNYESMNERCAEAVAVSKQMTERATLAERYYVMTQMPDTWHAWTCSDRELWIRAYEATLPAEPPVKMVTVTLPQMQCIRTSKHGGHVTSGGNGFCIGVA